MKKCLKRLLQCSIVLLLFNCQSEDLALDGHEHKQLKITEKTFEELMADSQFKTAFAKIPKGKSATSNSLQARTVMEAQYGFTIADTPAKVIETDNKISYTLLISREEENNLYFENLIIQVDSTNQTKAAVVKYISGQDMPAIENAASFEAVAEITPIVFDASFAGRGLLSCISISTSKCNGRPWNCGGMICGFNTDTYCVGGGGPGTPATPITYISTTTNPGSSGGGGGGESTSPNHGTTNPTPEPDPSNPQNPADNFGNLLTTPVKPTALERFIVELDAQQLSWWNNAANNNKVQAIAGHLIVNSYSESSKIFAKWCIDYLRSHPNVTVEQFKNWYIGNSEGNDDFYDETFWEDPSLDFPQQDLPNWNDFENATLKNSDGSYMSGADAVYSYIGGQVWQARLDNPNTTKNTCALKISRALNYSGIDIPSITTSPGRLGTLQGNDGKYYFLNAQALRIWMRETFGTNPATETTPFNENHFSLKSIHYPEGVITASSIAGFKGIYVMTPSNPTSFGASGHCDIVDNTWCPFNCFLKDAEEIEIWILEIE